LAVAVLAQLALQALVQLGLVVAVLAQLVLLVQLVLQAL
jgi:hypothetical protein